MAYGLTSNRPTSATTSTVAVHPLTFSSADYKVFATKPGEATYRSSTGSDITGIYDTWAKLSVGEVQNVYANNVDRRLRLPSQGGIKVYAQLIENQKVSDPSDPTLPEYLAPFSGSVAITVPKHALVSAAAVKDFARYLLGLILWDDEDHLASLFRGVTEFVEGSEYTEE